MGIIVVRIEKRGDRYWAYSKDVEGLEAQGESIPEVKENIDKYIKDTLRLIKRKNLPEQLRGNFRIAFKSHPGGDAIDFGDDELMAKDLWQFIVKNPDRKTSVVNKENFLQEAIAMFITIREYEKTKADLKHANSNSGIRNSY